MVGPYVSLLVEGKSDTNEPCYGCHNHLTHSMFFNDATHIFQGWRQSRSRNISLNYIYGNFGDKYRRFYLLT